MNSKVSIIISYLCLVLLISCEKADPPIVKTRGLLSVDKYSAVIRGDIISDGNATITECGIEYDTNPDYVAGTGTMVKSDSNGLGEFAVTIEGLQALTDYYYCAYAINSEGTAYGDKSLFTTNASPPLVRTLDAYTKEFLMQGDDGYTIWVVLNLEIIDNGASPLIGCGFDYDRDESHVANPSSIIYDRYQPNSSGEFVLLMRGWDPGETYYYAAAASNTGSTGFGEIKSFTVPIIPPTVVTKTASNITSTTVTLSGEVTHTGISDVDERGIEYSFTSTFIARATERVQADVDWSNSGTGTFSVDITGLNPGVTYYYRAFAISDAGERRGARLSFETTDNS